MNTDELPVTKRPRKVPMNTDNITSEDPLMIESENAIQNVNMSSKPESPSLEVFLNDPTSYRPRLDFLGANYVEVNIYLSKAS